MGRVRTKRYEAGGISRERYLELLWLSRQYDTMRRNRPGDPLSWRAKVIESAAQTAAGDLWPYVLQNVTHGRVYPKNCVNEQAGAKESEERRRAAHLIAALCAW